MVDVDLYQEALQRFQQMLGEAAKENNLDPTAMTVATADALGRPSVRTVLLKDYGEQGFVFFTNNLSRKGQDLAINPHAALCFYWHPLHQQITIEGKVEPITSEQDDTYWATRPRESQLSAWASKQSAILDSRTTLETRLEEYKKLYRNKHVPRPTYWSGYRILPDRMEFWQSGWHRLHERICYHREDGQWHKSLLYP